MRNHLSNLLAWRTRRTLNQLGLAGVAGLGMLAFCAMFYFSTILPADREAQALRHEAGLTQAKSLPAGPQRLQPSDQLETFYKTFPHARNATDALARIYHAAASQGLTIEQGEYHLARNSSDKLARYEISLPVKGDYLRIRKFLSQMLTAAPYVSLDSVDFQRQKISDTMVETQIKMTLYLLRE